MNGDENRGFLTVREGRSSSVGSICFNEEIEVDFDLVTVLFNAGRIVVSIECRRETFISIGINEDIS